MGSKEMLVIGLLLLTVCCVGTVNAADSGSLPDDAQKVLDQMNKDVAKARDKAANDLQRLQDRETKAGHLDAAIAIKEQIADLRGEPSGSAPGPSSAKPSSAEALVDQVRTGTMDVAMWNSIKAPELVCKDSDGWTDTKGTLTAGQHALIIPNPSDTWESSAGSSKATYLGETFKQGEWNRESMLVRVGESVDAVKRVGDYPIVEGPGRIYLGSHDAGAPPSQHVGSIRVKIILLPH